MPNDAKWGLALGVIVVLAVAVVFFRKEAFPSLPGLGGTAAVAVPKAGRPESSHQSRPIDAKAAGRSEASAKKAQD